MVGKQHLHAQSTGNVGRGLAQHTFTKNAQGAAVQVADGVIEETKLLFGLPAPLEHIVAVSH